MRISHAGTEQQSRMSRPNPILDWTIFMASPIRPDTHSKP